MLAFQRNIQKNNWFSIGKISKFRLVGGIISGVLFAFSLYALMYMGRETLRILSYNVYTHELWVLPEDTVHFYNLFFAYVAVIFGQSVCFNIWFDRPKKMFEYKDLRITNFVLNQKNLNWVFLFFLLSFARAVGIFLARTYYLYFDFGLFPDFQWMFVLIIIVLYAHSIMDYRPKFGLSGIKFIGISLLSVVLLSWGLSKVNLINYHHINKKLQNHNLFQKYDLQLPVVPYAIRYRTDRLYTGNIVLKNSNKPELIYENKPLSFEHLPGVLFQKKAEFREEERPLLNFFFMIEKSVKMQYINQLKLILQKENFESMIFNVLPEDYYLNRNIAFKSMLSVPLGYVFEDSLALVKKIRKIDSIAQIISLNIEASGCLRLQDTLYQSSTKIRKKFSQIIRKNPRTYLILKTDNQAKFDAYAKVLSAYEFSLDSLRKDYIKNYSGNNVFGAYPESQETYPYLLLDLIETERDY